MKLEDKTIVVTGGSSGIGAAISKAFHAEGSNVVIGYFSRESNAVDLAEALDSSGSTVMTFGGDLASETKPEELVSAAVNKFGSVDVLVNCAGGVMAEGILPNTSLEVWQTNFNANLFSAVMCTQAAIKVMEPGSKIINIGSVLGERFGGTGRIPSYSAAKAALHNFTQTMAEQLAPAILVNAVSPGRTITDAYDRMSVEDRERLGSVNKTGRWIQPEEIADGVIFVAKNDSMVGEILTIDAGFFLN